MSHNVIFKCNTYLINNNDNTPINLPSLNNILTLSTIINNLINSTENKCNMLL